MGRAEELWRYDGRRAVVTGCASGIGAEVAGQLTELGAEVIGMDLRRPATQLHDFVEIDLADPASVERAASAVAGRVDVLFNVAGLSSGGGSPRQVVAVNFLGPRLLTTLLAGRMPPGSAVAMVSSLAAQGYLTDLPTVRGLLATSTVADGLAWCEANPEAIADGASYRVSKAAVLLYTMDQAENLAGQGIRINCSCPGVTETPILNDTRAMFGQDYLDNIPKPLGRVAEAGEQASVLVFLNSRAAAYLSGEVLWVDGGHVSGQRARELIGKGEPA